MKTSLVCLLLLAAVACAAPQAGEVPEAMPIEAPGEMAVGAEEAAAVETALEGEGGKREARFGFGYSYCYGPCGGYGCFFDGCYSPYDIIFYSGYCACCRVRSIYQCY